MILKKRIINSSEKGLKDGWTRDTFIIRKDYLENIRALAYWERKKVKEVIDEILGSYLGGKRVKPVRNERRRIEGREW
ncbi:MAG: hypothetical protein ACXVAB_15645 [Thermodesulfobacteriota bacterium]